MDPDLHDLGVEVAARFSTLVHLLLHRCDLGEHPRRRRVLLAVVQAKRVGSTAITGAVHA